MVILCDQVTSSDGEAVTEGFRRLGLGKVIGMRTWGGEIWLSMDNRLVDGGIASAAELGVYGPESRWLIEGHGVDPDIAVDNLPWATFKGKDAQLETAIEYLTKQIAAEPVPEPVVPAYPDKSFKISARDKPLPVIFDTDMGPDYDDVGAITLLHAFADSGKADILATIASNKYEGVAAVIDVLNTWFHRPGIPIGVPKGNAVDQKDWQHWTDTILANYPHAIHENAQAENAVTLYRRVLSRQPDHSVVIITTGFLTNLADLLKSPPDKIDNLDGQHLVQQKVKKLVSMAGRFPQGKEFNIAKDSTASAYVFDNWPTPILLSGFEIGVKIKTGLPLVNNAAIQNSPVKDVFRISLPMAKEDRLGRSSWDETAVLVGIAGYKPWYTINTGRMHVLPDGSNTWEPDANGPHAYLVETPRSGEVQDLINMLIMHRPG
jgi:inosine-uridine nucleoside N-ribohydrolase